MRERHRERRRGREAPTAAVGGSGWRGLGSWRGLGRGRLRRGLFGRLRESFGQGLGDVGLAGPPEDLVVAQVARVGDCLHVAFGGVDEFDEVAVVIGQAQVHVWALRIYGRRACCARTKVVVRGCELGVSGCGGRGRKICGFAAGKGGLVRICAHEGGCACLCARWWVVCAGGGGMGGVALVLLPQYDRRCTCQAKGKQCRRFRLSVEAPR